jgi:hypothetical protein
MFASALQSCQTQVEIPDGAVYPILFGSTETRAVADLDDLKTNGFKVYAYFKGSQEGYGNGTFEKDVRFEDSYWKYDNLEYWIPNTTYYFKAFYPKDLNNLTVNNTSASQKYTATTFDISKQVDFMVATDTRSVNAKAEPEGGSVVTLNFEHQLALVEIKIKSAISVTIKNITLNNIATGYQCIDGVWSQGDDGNKTDFVYVSDTKLTPGADYADVTGGGILVIPSMTDSETFTIEASNKTYSEISLPAGTEWEKGRKYTYTMEIKQNDIIFNEPKVEIWDSESATGSVIIK